MATNNLAEGSAPVLRLRWRTLVSPREKIAVAIVTVPAEQKY